MPQEYIEKYYVYNQYFLYIYLSACVVYMHERRKVRLKPWVPLEGVRGGPHGRQVMNRRGRMMRWLVIVGMSGILPGFVMRCDKAALNFQRGLFQGLGEETSELLLDQFPADGE